MAVTGPYIKAFEWIVRQPDLTASAKLLYCQLWDRARWVGPAFPKIAELSQKLGTSQRSLDRAIDELKTAGLLKVTRGRWNSYSFSLFSETDCGAKLAVQSARVRRQVGVPDRVRRQSGAPDSSECGARSVECGAKLAPPAYKDARTRQIPSPDTKTDPPTTAHAAACAESGSPAAGGAPQDRGASSGGPSRRGRRSTRAPGGPAGGQGAPSAPAPARARRARPEAAIEAWCEAYRAAHGTPYRLSGPEVNRLRDAQAAAPAAQLRAAADAFLAGSIESARWNLQHQGPTVAGFCSALPKLLNGAGQSARRDGRIDFPRVESPDQEEIVL